MSIDWLLDEDDVKKNPPSRQELLEEIGREAGRILRGGEECPHCGGSLVMVISNDVSIKDRECVACKRRFFSGDLHRNGGTA